MSAVRVGMLHTVPLLAADFERLVTDAMPGVDVVHRADPSLLARAREGGVTPDVEADVARHLAALRDAGASAILVTCSSIGGAVDRAATGLDLPVLRVDRPMAVEAVRTAAAGFGRIAVLATLSATLQPTSALIETEAERAGVRVTVTSTVVDGAFEARAQGHDAEHDAAVRRAAEAAAGEGDVLVLAQASMARALTRNALGVPVLTSPESGAAALVSVLERERGR